MLESVNDSALTRNPAIETNDEVGNTRLIEVILAVRQDLHGFVATSWALERVLHMVCLAVLRVDSCDLHAQAASLTTGTVRQIVESRFDCRSVGRGSPMIYQRDGHGHWMCKTK